MGAVVRITPRAEWIIGNLVWGVVTVIILASHDPTDIPPTTLLFIHGRLCHQHRPTEETVSLIGWICQQNLAMVRVEGMTGTGIDPCTTDVEITMIGGIMTLAGTETTTGIGMTVITRATGEVTDSTVPDEDYRRASSREWPRRDDTSDPGFREDSWGHGNERRKMDRYMPLSPASSSKGSRPHLDYEDEARTPAGRPPVSKSPAYRPQSPTEPPREDRPLRLLDGPPPPPAMSPPPPSPSRRTLDQGTRSAPPTSEQLLCSTQTTTRAQRRSRTTVHVFTP